LTTKPQPRRHPEAASPIIIPGPGAAPDDEEPLPDAMFLEPYFTETMMVVRTYFENRDDGLVSGKSPIYYHDSDGRLQWVMPDCYVAFGVDEVAIRRRDSYFIHEVGKPPDFVLEIASESTYGNDLGPKRKLYARLGIGEYWRFDATGGSYYGVALAGERLEDGEYRPMEVHRDSDGVRWGHSPALGLDLCWHDGRLRFYKPASGAYLLNLSESLAARTEAERTVSALARQSAAEARADAAEAENLQLRERLRRLQEQQSAPNGDEDSLPEAR
jgi:Uma2 family endonuclease